MYRIILMLTEKSLLKKKHLPKAEVKQYEDAMDKTCYDYRDC